MKLLAVGYGDSSDILGNRLPTLFADIQEELKASATAFHVDPEMLTGRDATAQLVTERLRGAQVFQFSGHVLTLGDDAALVLAPSGSSETAGQLLWASRLPTEAIESLHLAVLAACSTGRPSDPNHSPRSDMARVFLSAGVPMVLGSSWDVDSRATSELIRRFYNALAGSNAIPAELAFKEATAAIRNEERFAHPYYWAAFALYQR